MRSNCTVRTFVVHTQRRRSCFVEFHLLEVADTPGFIEMYTAIYTAQLLLVTLCCDLKPQLQHSNTADEGSRCGWNR
jgi:hypothetical protein